MQYRRAKFAGGTYFFTVVTHYRRRILCEQQNIDLLRHIFAEVMDNHPFTIDACVVLPDHLHCIWTLPPDDNDFSTRWRLIKGTFSRKCQPCFHGISSSARRRKQEQAIWQRRFWEHAIRNETDHLHHVDYIHYNPVKHGLVSSLHEWPYSSFHRFVDHGIYPADWGTSEITLPENIGRE